MNGFCIVVGAGDFSEKNIEYTKNDFIIAADGGLKHLEKINIKPNMVIGDFDSMAQSCNAEKIVRLPREKDITDMSAAIEEGIKKGYTKFKIYGGTGGRTDHTIANIQKLAYLAQKGYEAELIGEKYIYRCISSGELCFDAENRGYISVFSFSDVSKGVFEKGLKYTLSDAELKNTEPLGVSNEFIGENASIAVREGILTVVYERKTMPDAEHFSCSCNTIN